MASVPSQHGSIIPNEKGIFSYYLDMSNETDISYLYQLFKELYSRDWSAADKSGKALGSIISFHAIPKSSTPISGRKTVYVGNMKFLYSAYNDGLRLLAHRFQLFDAGSIEIPATYGNYLDYPPYTRVTIHLPFIGDREIDHTPFVGHHIYIKYQVDFFTGDTICYLCNSDSAIYYEFSGNCIIQFPMSGSDYTRNNAGVMQAIAGTVATVGGVIAKNPAMIAGGAISAASGVIAAFQPPSTMVTSTLTGSTGWMGTRQAYVILTRPKFTDSDAAQGYPVVGRQCHKYGSLTGYSGFTKIAEIQMKSFPGQKSELEECLALLKEGVIL